MKDKVKSVSIILSLAAILILQFGCKSEKGEETNSKSLDKNYLMQLLNERAYKDSSMQFAPYSPFNRDPKAEYKKLNYYEPNSEFIFTSKLFENDTKDTVDVYGTLGEIRRVIEFGYVVLNYRNDEYKVNVYKAFGADGTPYFSIWFTDKTTGKETYGVGRYLDFNKEDDPDHIYTIDFNRAYNPYCAYSAQFTCPIPRQEDYINIEIKAGEKNFH